MHRPGVLDKFTTYSNSALTYYKMLTRGRQVIRRQRRQTWRNWAGSALQALKRPAGTAALALAPGLARQVIKHTAKKAVQYYKGRTVKKSHPPPGAFRDGTGHFQLQFSEKRPAKKHDLILLKGQSRRYDTRTVTGKINVAVGQQNNNFTEFSVLTPWDIRENSNFQPLDTTLRQYIQWVRVRLMATNMTNTHACLTIRLVKPKRDQQEPTDSPQNDWAAGLIAIGGTTGYLLPGSSPQESPDFRQKWKVIKTWKKSLTLGEGFTLDYFFRCNHRVNSRVIHDMTDPAKLVRVTDYGQGAYNPLTRYFMITAHGMPAGDLAAVGDVSLANVAVGLVLTETVLSRRFSVNSEFMDYVNTLPTTARRVMEPDGDNVAITSAE